MKPLKPNIFVSSTVYDLPNERAAAKKAIEQLQAIPVMSEYTMNAVDKPSVQACVDAVSNSDFYILILGARYGWVLENGISITELEYDTAFKNGIPIFVFNTPYEKEDNQEKFAKKVGSQRFWKNVKDAFELQDEIIKSYNQYIEEQKYEKFSSTELLTSNLVEISFPKTLFIADLDINRNEVIEKSWETEFKLKKKDSDYKVAKAAISQKGYTPWSDFVLHENKMITFHDLGNYDVPLGEIVDGGTIEEINTVDFYSVNKDYLNVFKRLLRFCLQRKLYHLGIKQKGKGLYAYIPDKDNNEKREIEWFGKVSATRTVFQLNRDKKNPDKIWNGKHFAFRAQFHLLNEKWYASFTPDWYISYDGYKESYYGNKQVSYLKKVEKNPHVLNHLRFIISQLTKHLQTNLFESNFDYQILKFNKLEKIEAYPKIKEDDWFKNESESAKRLLNEKILSLDL